MLARRACIFSALAVVLLTSLLLSSQVSNVMTSFLEDESRFSDQNHPGPAEDEPSGWSSAYYISHPLLSQPVEPRIAVSGSVVHVIWEDLRLVAQGLAPEVFYRRSTDSGASWSEERVLSDYASTISYLPQVAAEGDYVIVLWNDGRGASYSEIYYTFSEDNGETWSDNMLLTPNDGFPSEGVRVLVKDGKVHVLWADERFGQYEVYYKNSTDGGLTWSNERRMTFWSAGTDWPGAIDTDGDYVHVLLTRYVGNSEAFYMKSGDNGSTWTTPVEVGDLDGHNSGGSGLVSFSSTVHICMVDLRTGRYQIHYRNSTDNGTTWNPLVRISNSTVKAMQCQMTADQQVIHVVWFDDKPDNKEIYYRNTTNLGIDWNEEVRLTFNADRSLQPHIGVNGSLIHVAWLEITYGGHVFYMRFPDFAPETDPPIAPALLSASLTNGSRDVRISWSMSEDEGLVGGTSRYVVNRGEDIDGPYFSVAEVNSSGSSTYEWTDIGAGEGDPKDYFYYVQSKDASNNTNRSGKAAKLSFHLNQGKHLVSIPLIQEDESAPIVLQTLSYDVAWSCDSVNKEWKKYSPFRNYNDLLEIDHRIGFWVNVTRESNLTVAGLVPTVTTINLSEGWNLVGFPSFNSSYTVADLKAEVGAIRAEGFDPSLPPFQLRVLGDTEVLQTREAYWMKVDADVDWIVEVS